MSLSMSALRVVGTLFLLWHFLEVEQVPETATPETLSDVVKQIS